MQQLRFSDLHGAPSIVRESELQQRELMGLIRAIAANDQRALARLYAITAARLHKIAFGVLGCAQDAEEIVGDTLMYVWGHSHQYDPQRGGVLAWLTVITRHRAIDHRRRRWSTVSMDNVDSSDRVTPPVSAEQCPEELWVQSEDHLAVDDALASLTPMRRHLIHLSFFEDHTHVKIAESLALPPGTVKSHLRRGVLAMRAAITARPEGKPRRRPRAALGEAARRYL